MVRDLAEAQKKIVEKLINLNLSHKNMREQVGGIAFSFEYRGEDDSYMALPSLSNMNSG